MCKDVRNRFWNVIASNKVLHIPSAIGRWRCPLCKIVFTHWPKFAIPGKRFVRKDIEDRVHRYAEDEARTYEDAASHNGKPILHELGPGCPPVRMAPHIEGMKDEPLPIRLARSTIWRWVQALGMAVAELNSALEIIKQNHPSSQIHRFVLSVRPAKFRLPVREGIIKTAAHFIRAMKEIRGPPTS